MIFIHFGMLALANLGAAKNLKAFSKRQGDGAFIPDTNIVEACAPNELMCDNYCLNLADGDVCCSEGYVCPGGQSFCLTKGYCCPNGLDPNTCALNNGVSLSAGFNTNPVPPTSAATATGSPSGAVLTSGNPPATSTSTGKFPATATTSQTVEPFLGGSGKVDSAFAAVIAAIAGVLGATF